MSTKAGTLHLDDLLARYGTLTDEGSKWRRQVGA